jgi:peptidoglycan/LPS O-acetylase OafA/YrhL
LTGNGKKLGSGFYLPGLNGFRAIAATIVLITHTLQYVGVTFLDTAASFGVTVFFALSGF